MTRIKQNLEEYIRRQKTQTEEDASWYQIYKPTY